MSEPKSNPYEVFTFPEFRWFILNRFFATMAFSIQFVVIEWEIYQLTKNVFYLGLIPLAEIIAVVIFSLFSGHYVDKWKKKLSLQICLISAIICTLIFSFIFSDYTISRFSIQKILIFTLLNVFFWGIIRAFYTPSAFSLFSYLIPKKHFPSGATWNASAWQIGAVLGPIIAGISYAFFGGFYTFFISLLFLILGLFFIFQIKEKELAYNHKEKIWNSLKQGFSFIYNNKIVFSAITIDLFAVLFGGAVALLPVFVADIIPVETYAKPLKYIASLFDYHFKDENQMKSFGLGILRGAPSIGALITMITITYFPVNHKSGMKLLIFVALFGMSIIGFGLSTSFWLSFVLLLLSGLFDGVSVVIRSTILQILTPDEMRGRVSAVNSIFVGSSNEFGAFESGLTAKLFGTVKAVVLGGSITLLVVIISFFKAKTLRNFEIKDFKN